MVPCLNNQHLATPQVGVMGAHNKDAGTIINDCIKYQKHQFLTAERKKILDSLPDGNNETSIAQINDEFAKRQQVSAAVLLNKTIYFCDGFLASGIPFDGKVWVSSVEMSEGSGSTLVILGATPLDEGDKPLQGNLIELAVTNETYILYVQ